SKQYLIPIGHTRLDDDRDALVTNLTKDQVNRFPGFDRDEFEALSERDIKRINDEIGAVLEPTASYRADEPYYEAWNRRFYQYPEWWEGMPVVPGEPSSVAYDDKTVEYSTRQSMPKRKRSQYVEPAEVHDTGADVADRAQP